jgi:hypothetical protein
MVDIKDSKTIKIIQGESLTAIFSVDDTYTDVSSATFVCKDLDLEIGLIPDNANAPDNDGSNSDSGSSEPVDTGNSNWYLWYQGDTNELRPGVFTYDVTIQSAEGIETIVYEGKLVVAYKTNPQHYNPYYEYPHNTKREH